MSWLFGSSSAPQESPAAATETSLPDLPPGLQTLPPPPAPLGQSIPSGSFSGFSDPPPAASVSAGPPRAPVSLSFTPPTRETDYNSEDLSKYTSPYTESSGVRDAEYASEILSRSGKSPSWLDKHVTNPRLRGCIDGVKMGMKMGCAVGGIFGGITGTYAAITNRNFLILPFSMVGGALSFGFFLGCGMIIRCQEPKLFRGPGGSSGVPLSSQRPRGFFLPATCEGLPGLRSPPLVAHICARSADRHE